MNPRRAGYLFLTQILVTIGASIGLSFGSSFFTLGIVANLLISELILIIPCIIFVTFFEKNPWRDDSIGYEDGLIPVGRKSMLALFLVPLFTAAVFPLITLCNAISMLFVDNVVVDLDASLNKIPFWLAFFLVAVYGPLCEEIAFRGVIYGGLRRSGNVPVAIVLQGLLFGLVHLNLNQFSYAFVIGCLMAILVEATGTIESSYFMHMCINGFTVCITYFSSADVPIGRPSRSVLVAAIIILSVMASVGLAIAWGIINIMAILSNRQDKLKEAFLGRENINKIHTISIPMVIAIVLSGSAIVAEAVLEHIHM